MCPAGFPLTIFTLQTQTELGTHSKTMRLIYSAQAALPIGILKNSMGRGCFSRMFLQETACCLKFHKEGRTI